VPDSGISDGSSFTSTFWDDYVREQVVCTCTSSTRPTGVTGRCIYETDTGKLKIYNGSGWTDVWANGSTGTYTPTLSGMAIGTGGSAANTATFSFANGILSVIGFIQFGTSGVTLPGAGGNINVSVPSGFSMLGASTTPIGQAMLTAAATNYHGIAWINSATAVRFLALAAGATYLTPAATSATVPGTWANGDIIRYSFAVPATF